MLQAFMCMHVCLLQVVKALARGGASIHELNTVRKALSQVKGGRLALAAHPARVSSTIHNTDEGSCLMCRIWPLPCLNHFF